MSSSDCAPDLARRIFDWSCVQHRLRLGERTLIMGILNVTPDSFSDGGRFKDEERAVARAMEMIEEGADLIDVGGESTRPGADAVDPDEELRRVIPVIEQICRQSEVPVSIDTTKAEVAEAALGVGACIVNDVSGAADPAMVDLVAQSGAGLVLMHMQGTPRTMQAAPEYEDVTRDVVEFLDDRIASVVSRGLGREQVCVDPGIGFGKTLSHNLELLRGLAAFQELGRPVLVGLSRKSFLGQLTGREVGDRLAGSLAGLVYAITRGAHILRVHDVKESCDTARIADILVSAEHNRE